MSLDENKKTAEKFIRCLSAHEDVDWIEANMCDDATYWVSGKPHLFGYAGTRGKEEFCAYARTPTIFVDGGIAPTFGAFTAEGDRVAVEAKSRGVLPDGRVYTNDYHYLFKFRDGKILEVKEYTDTYAAAEFFSK